MSDDLVGTTWRINDSGRRFVVVSVQAQYAVVENLLPPARRRRILLSALRTSRRKTGYTQILDPGVVIWVGSSPSAPTSIQEES